MLIRALIISLVLIFAHAVEAEELPIQDNALVLSMEAGPLLLSERDDAEHLLRMGGQFDLGIGLSKRATSWLDVELMLGASLLTLGGEGFVQTLRKGTRSATTLPGTFALGRLQLVADQEGGILLALDARASLYDAPAEGALMRLLFALGLGWDLVRERDTRTSLLLVYDLPFRDDLIRESGLPFDGWQHGLRLRLSYSF